MNTDDRWMCAWAPKLREGRLELWVEHDRMRINISHQIKASMSGWGMSDVVGDAKDGHASLRAVIVTCRPNQ